MYGNSPTVSASLVDVHCLNSVDMSEGVAHAVISFKCNGKKQTLQVIMIVHFLENNKKDLLCNIGK